MAPWASGLVRRSPRGGGPGFIARWWPVPAMGGEVGEVCVCELPPAFDLSQPTISHHLKLLRQAGLIDCERRGTWVYYWVLPGLLDKLAAFLTSP
ncbi:ArsR/SmtB family transcription factor [Streptomyces avermitilis]|uniref:ArsR/SmtB family transcription factor n=1 Tax=Streptomyces avermitilis TaxID=33903 RepID=UPI0038026EB8